MYIEASRRPNGESATLKYTFKYPVENGCFSLYYHMHGADMGALSIGASNGSYHTLWYRNGEAGKKWMQASVPINSNTKIVSSSYKILQITYVFCVHQHTCIRRAMPACIDQSLYQRCARDGIDYYLSRGMFLLIN